SRWMWPSFGTSLVEVNRTTRPPTRRRRTRINACRPVNTWPGRGDRNKTRALVDGRDDVVSGRMIGGRTTARARHDAAAPPAAHASHAGTPGNARLRHRATATEPNNTPPTARRGGP